MTDCLSVPLSLSLSLNWSLSQPCTLVELLAQLPAPATGSWHILCLPSLSTSHYPSVKGQCCHFLLLLLVARLLCPLCRKCYQFYTPLIISPAPSPLLLTWRLLLSFDVFLSLSSCLCSLIFVCFELYTNFWLSIWTLLPRGTARPRPHSPQCPCGSCCLASSVAISPSLSLRCLSFVCLSI